MESISEYASAAICRNINAGWHRHDWAYHRQKLPMRPEHTVKARRTAHRGILTSHPDSQVASQQEAAGIRHHA